MRRSTDRKICKCQAHRPNTTRNALAIHLNFLFRQDGESARNSSDRCDENRGDVYLSRPIERGCWPSSMRHQRSPRLDSGDDARVHHRRPNVCHRVNRLISARSIPLCLSPSPSPSTWTCHLISTISDLEAPAWPTESNDEKRRGARCR